MSTPVIHTSYTEKAGYVWRKRYASNTLSVALHTKAPAEATRRSSLLTIRFMQLETLDVPFVAMRDAIKAYRNELMKGEKLAMLQGLLAANTLPEGKLSEALQGVQTGEAMQSPSFEPTTQQSALERVTATIISRELEQQAGHSLEEVKKAYFDANTEWKQKTIKDYSACIDRFIIWAASNQIMNIESITKENIIEFKAYMDEVGLASLTKQKILTRLSSMFSFAVDVKEWASKNMVTGMMYKKVSVEKPKEEITPEQFNLFISQNTVINDKQNYWANVLMYYTGMRVSEMQQITKADYIEIEGIKCISVNTLEEGKSTKTETSKRNIPLCEAILALGVWDEKPIMKNGLNSIMDKISRSYKAIGMKRSSHCYRHSISNRLRDTGCEDSTRYFILGHAQQTMTDRVYITRLPLMKMQAALNEAN